MKIIKTFILSLTVIITFVSASAFGSYSGGTGEPNSPYQIASKADLQTLAADINDYDKCFIVTADVNMAGQVFTTAIIASNYETAFTGTFDGNGHKVTDFTINGDSYVGLFGQINSGGFVKNLGLANFVVSSSSDSVGGLVAYNYGTIINCYSTGAVSGDSDEIGGLVGENDGSISKCYSAGQVSGDANEIGGLVGENDGSINNCYFTGRVNSDSNSCFFGGLAGENYGSINNCYSTGTVIGASYIGGLVGKNFSIGGISKCYSTGQVSGSYSVGGLVGWNDGNISNCYSMDALNGSSDSDFVGGLVGVNDGNTLNCYSTGSVTGSQYVSGLVGIGSGSVLDSFWDANTSGQITSGGGTGETTAQMKTLSTFTSAGWNFTTDENSGTWRMCSNGVNYPLLQWQFNAADFVCPNGVGMEDLNYFVQRWLESGCSSFNNCSGADMNASGKVDFLDFAMFAQNWLSGQ